MTIGLFCSEQSAVVTSMILKGGDDARSDKRTGNNIDVDFGHNILHCMLRSARILRQSRQRFSNAARLW